MMIEPISLPVPCELLAVTKRHGWHDRFTCRSFLATRNPPFESNVPMQTFQKVGYHVRKLSEVIVFPVFSLHWIQCSMHSNRLRLEVQQSFNLMILMFSCQIQLLMMALRCFPVKSSMALSPAVCDMAHVHILKVEALRSAGHSRNRQGAVKGGRHWDRSWHALRSCCTQGRSGSP